jgi:protocatechuate 3,4-dioxygenase beta subunit
MPMLAAMCDHHSSTLDGGHRSRVTRRGALGAAGAGGVALLFAGIRSGPAGNLLDAFGPDIAEAAAASCVMTPAKTEGPYFVDEKLNRSDVRANTGDGAVQAGVALTLRMYVFDAANDCAPVQGATVDIWHANADGKYSDEAVNGTAGQNWLRGFQMTDANGLVTFKTVYPGWYSGRAVHIHFKVRLPAQSLEFTSQMFFTDAMNSAVFASSAPYSSRPTPNVTDGQDSILGSDAATLTLHPTSDGSGGLTADFSVGLSNSSTSGNGSGTTADTSLLAALKATTMIRTALGTRQLRLKIKTKETITVSAKLTRAGKTIASRTVKLAAGTKNVRVTIPATGAGGAAKLKLTLADGAGNKRSYTRNVHVASRSST